MISDGIKAISCLILSAVGWVVLIIGFLNKGYSPSGNEFSVSFNDAFLGISCIAAIVIHVTNCILGIIFLLQRTVCRKTCWLGLSVSIIFLVCCVVFYFFVLF